MSDTPQFGFGNFVPGFDFLKNLAQGKSQAANPAASLPHMSSWVAPTLSVEEIEKRIQELKTVQFWLDQNGRALAATVQALEVQKMTLSTLKGMNVSMSELAKAFQFVPSAGAAAADTAAHTPSSHDDQRSASTEAVPTASTAAPDDGLQAGGKADASAPSVTKEEENTEQTLPKGLVDPMQWWGALTNQFQQIAATAMHEAARHAQPDATTDGAEKKAPQFAGSAEQAQQAEKTLKAATEAATTMTSAMAQQAAQHMSAVQQAAAQAMKAVIPAAAPKATTTQRAKTGVQPPKTTKAKVQPAKSKAKAAQAQPPSTAGKGAKVTSAAPKPNQAGKPTSLPTPAQKRVAPSTKKPPSIRR